MNIIHSFAVIMFIFTKNKTMKTPNNTSQKSESAQITSGIIWSIKAVAENQALKLNNDSIKEQAKLFVNEPHTVQELRAYYWDLIYKFGLHSSQQQRFILQTSKQAA